MGMHTRSLVSALRGVDITSFQLPIYHVPVQIACLDIVAVPSSASDWDEPRLGIHPSTRKAPRRIRSNGDPEIMRDPKPAQAH